MFAAYAAKCKRDWIDPMLNTKDPYFGIDEENVTGLYSAWTEKDKEAWRLKMQHALPKGSRINMRVRFFEDLYGMHSGTPIFLGEGKQGEFNCVAIMVVNGDPRYVPGVNLPHQRPVRIVWQGDPVRIQDFDWVNNRLQPLDTSDRLLTGFEWYVRLTASKVPDSLTLNNGKYGLTHLEWEGAKEEIRNVLIKCAKDQKTIPYSHLTARLTTVKLAPDSPALHQMLGEISVEENEAERGMLSVLVVHKSGDMKPGKGFFELARELGRNVDDINQCWIHELLYVFTYWEKHSQ